MLTHSRRRLVHFNVTEHPTAEWTARQLLEACALEERPRYLIRDRDQVYGERFSHQARMLGIQEAVIAPRSPWENAYAERVIGSIRRECCGDRRVAFAENPLGICLVLQRDADTLITGKGRARAAERAATDSGESGRGAPRRWAPSRMPGAGGVSR